MIMILALMYMCMYICMYVYLHMCILIVLFVLHPYIVANYKATLVTQPA